MIRLTRFSTQTLAPHHRFPAWVDQLRRFFGEVHAAPQDTTRYEAWAESISESTLVVTRMYAGPQMIEHADGSPYGEHRGFVHVVFPLRGCFHVEQAGRSIQLEPGDWGVYDLSKGFRSIADRPVELIVLAAPKALIFGGHPGIADIMVQRFSSRSGSARIVRDFMVSLLEERRTLSPALRHDFAEFALQLARLSILESTAPSRPRRSPRALRLRVETYIINHLRDADLSIGTIAAACRCSKRYIHKIFAPHGRTASQYILDRRLAGCARDLANAELSCLSITDIAVSWGFKSSSSFSRVFRKHFHTPPRIYRLSRSDRAATPVPMAAEGQPGTQMSGTSRDGFDRDQRGRNRLVSIRSASER